MKTNKAYRKRLRVTKKGKILSRKAGQNHFNSRESSRQKGAKRRTLEIVMSNKNRGRFLSNQ
jgi:ribosomal protein L35